MVESQQQLLLTGKSTEGVTIGGERRAKCFRTRPMDREKIIKKQNTRHRYAYADDGWSHCRTRKRISR